MNKFKAPAVCTGMKHAKPWSYFVVAALTLMLTPGCVCTSNGGGGGNLRGDVTFRWSFSQRQCALVPGVTNVAIVIPNQTLENQGVYPCNTAGSDGIRLLNFRPGQYNFQIFGRDQSGTILYEASGTFAVDGDVTVTVDLNPSATAPGSALVSYSLPANGAFPNPDCAQAGAVNVAIRIDNLEPQFFSCAQGFGGQAIQMPLLAPGRHTIDIAAADATNYYLYRRISTLDISPGVTIAASYGLEWSVGTTAIRWAISDGTLARTCAEAGVNKVVINFRNLTDAVNVYRYEGAGVEVDCSTNNVQGHAFATNRFVNPYLYPGTYQVFVQGAGPGVLFSSNKVTPPTITVAANVFAQLDPNTPVIQLSRVP
jgi:hypothetical protein